jgi:hypothetical protein
MRTYEANALAIKESAKAIREALLHLGMRRCSLRLVHYQAEAPTKTRRDWYALFWRWFLAIWIANRPGAEFLLEDFEARVLALRERENLSDSNWAQAVARCSDKHAHAIREAILNSDAAAIKKAGAQAITAYRTLLSIVEARGERLDERGGPNLVQHTACGSVRPAARAKVA